MAAQLAVGSSLREYARGAVGGLLFSLPILYTMEMWWAGFLCTPTRLLSGLCATFVMLALYNLYAGLRRDASVAEILVDSVEEMGLGLTGAAVMLWLLNRIDLSMAPLEIAGKVVVEGMVTAIGVSVGTAQLGGNSKSEQGAPVAYRDQEPWRHLSLAACGAMLLAANVAPTEEIKVLAAELSAAGVLGLAVVSFIVGAIVLHYSDFTSAVPARETGYFAAARSTTQSYAVALLVSAASLWFYGRFTDEAGAVICAQIVVLGFASMLGASAGRLLLQPS